MLFRNSEIVERNKIISLNGKDSHNFSYSTLSRFDQMGRSFFLKEKPPPTTVMKFGQLVEDILFNDEDFLSDKYKFVEYIIPTASTKELADFYILELLSKEDELEFKVDEKLALELARVNNLWSRLKDDKVLSKLTKDFWTYIEVEVSQIKNKTPIVIPYDSYESAYKTAETFLADPIILNYFRDKRVLLQPRYYLDVLEEAFISIPDVGIIDKDNNLEAIVDLKIKNDASVNSFMYRFLNFRLDIQNTIYHKILTHYPIYKFKGKKDVRFLVGSNISNNPQFFKTDLSSIVDFETKTKSYLGIESLLDRFKYYQENGAEYPMNYTERGYNHFSLKDL